MCWGTKPKDLVIEVYDYLDDGGRSFVSTAPNTGSHHKRLRPRGSKVKCSRVAVKCATDKDRERWAEQAPMLKKREEDRLRFELYGIGRR